MEEAVMGEAVLCVSTPIERLIIANVQQIRTITPIKRHSLSTFNAILGSSLTTSGPS